MFPQFLYLKPGTKIDDYWEVGKSQLQDPGKFLESLFQYDKDNIPMETIKKIEPYIQNPNFTPEAISKVKKTENFMILFKK